MKAYWGALKQVLFSVKPYSYTAKVGPSDLLSSATVAVDDEGPVLTLEFTEAVRDGNQIDGMVILEEGRGIEKQTLLPGETKTSLFFNGFDIGEAEYEIAFIDTNEQVIETDTVQIQEVQR
jgi:hypothetical protein